jgi:hypothetical protein
MHAQRNQSFYHLSENNRCTPSLQSAKQPFSDILPAPIVTIFLGLQAKKHQPRQSANR